jgi:hypothetical protein
MWWSLSFIPWYGQPQQGALERPFCSWCPLKELTSGASVTGLCMAHLLPKSWRRPWTLPWGNFLVRNGTSSGTGKRAKGKGQGIAIVTCLRWSSQLGRNQWWAVCVTWEIGGFCWRETEGGTPRYVCVWEVKKRLNLVGAGPLDSTHLVVLNLLREDPLLLSDV